MQKIPSISDEHMAFLKVLVETPGVPGREAQVRALIQKRATVMELFDELRVDTLGSLIGVRKPRTIANTSKPAVRVLLSAHLDQVGFLVSHVSRKGFLRLHPVGAFDTRTLVSQRVKIYCESGSVLTGVLVPEGHPVHTAPQSEDCKIRKLNDFYVDLGNPLVSADLVRPGDMVVFDIPFADLGNSVAGPALDNRLGCWALMMALEKLSEHACEITAVWSCQEELGSRGIEPVGFSTSIDIGISCDTVVCCDVPGVPEEQSVCTLGDGVALVVADSSTLSDMDLIRQFEQIALSGNISVQRCLMEGGGQDGAVIQRSRDGVRTAVLSCPVRYMHTSNEMASKVDILAYAKLLAAFLAAL